MLNNELAESVKDLVTDGFLIVGQDGRYITQRSAFVLVDTLDQMFPEILVMNLVACSIQTIDEVVSGRKDISLALEQFHHMLNSQKSASAARAASAKFKKEKLEDAEARRAVYLERISKIKNKRGIKSPRATLLTCGSQAGDAEIKEIFPLQPKNESEMQESSQNHPNIVSRSNTVEFASGPIAPVSGMDSDNLPTGNDGSFKNALPAMDIPPGRKHRLILTEPTSHLWPRFSQTIQIIRLKKRLPQLLIRKIPLSMKV